MATDIFQKRIKLSLISLLLQLKSVKIKNMENYSIRQNKVSTLIQHEMANIFMFKARELAHGKMISVTKVRISKDLSAAKVYISVFPSEGSEAVLESIQEHASALRGELGRKVGKQLRIVPELSYFVDDSLDYIENIDSLLSE